MRYKNRHIIPLLLFSFAALVLYQSYWLNGLFRSSLDAKRSQVEMVLQKADYVEIMTRLRDINEDSDSETVSMDAGWADESNSANVKISVRSDSSVEDASPNSATLTMSTMGESNAKDALTAAEELSNYYQRGLHVGVDALADINIERLDSLVNVNLAEIGITVPHCLTVWYQDGRNVRLPTPGYVYSEKAEDYSMTYGMNDNEKYVLTLRPVAYIVLREMGGVILASLLLFLILSLSFWFLIHTMMRQKSIEEMKSDFTNNITHELKTPVAVAYAANDALLNHGASENPDKLREYLGISMDQLKKLEGMIEQILSMSMESRKSFELRKEHIELLPLITSLIKQHKLSAEKPCEFIVDVKPGLSVHADRFHITNIISNLIENAKKYSRESVTLHISGRIVDGKGVEISVQDNGIGIPHDKQKHVFDKFYRVPTGNIHEVDGYGLGLYYVKNMVEKHGGTISLNSELGKGSRFTIMIP